MPEVTLGVDVKSCTYLVICSSAFCCLFRAPCKWLEGVRGPLVIKILWTFLLTSRNLQSEFVGSVQFFHFRLGVLSVWHTISPNGLGLAISFSRPENLLKRKQFFTLLYPRHCRWQLAPYTAHPYNIIIFCLHCIYFTASDMPNHTRSKYLLLATNLSP